MYVTPPIPDSRSGPTAVCYCGMHVLMFMQAYSYGVRQPLVSKKDRIMTTNSQSPLSLPCPSMQRQRRYSASQRVLNLPHSLQRSSSGCCDPVGRVLPPCPPARDRRCTVRNGPLVVIIRNPHRDVVSQRQSDYLVTSPAYSHSSGACLLGPFRDLRHSSPSHRFFQECQLSIVYCKHTLSYGLPLE